MQNICEETKALVYVCEAIHNRLAYQRLTNDDRDLIELSCINLLTKLRPEFRTGNAGQTVDLAGASIGFIPAIPSLDNRATPSPGRSSVASAPAGSPSDGGGSMRGYSPPGP